MNDSKLYTIENTKQAQSEFGHAYGSEWIKITEKQIRDLRSGKQLAFSDGEYTSFISLNEPK